MKSAVLLILRFHPFLTLIHKWYHSYLISLPIVFCSYTPINSYNAQQLHIHYSFLFLSLYSYSLVLITTSRFIFFFIFIFTFIYPFIIIYMYIPIFKSQAVNLLADCEVLHSLLFLALPGPGAKSIFDLTGCLI